MIHTLNEVKGYLSTYLQRAGARERKLNVGQVLDPLNFIKEDHAPLIGKVDTFTLSTLSGPCCGPDRSEGTPEHTALALWEKLELFLALVPKAAVHISNPYLDYTKGTIYHERANWKTLVDVAVYSYDGTSFKTVRNALGLGASEMVPALDFAIHTLSTVMPFQIKVFEPNVLSQLSHEVTKPGVTESDFFTNLRSDFDRAVKHALTQFADMEQRVASLAPREPEDSAPELPAHTVASDLYRAGKYQEFVEYVATYFDSPITIHISEGFIEGFELDGKCYTSTELVAMMNKGD